MKQKSLVQNAVWNFLYTGMNMIFPLLVAPYVTRVLGASNLGKVDFAKSILQWFLVFAIFGITTYGVREVAKVRGDEKKLSKIFSELLTISILFSVLATLIYFIFIFNSGEISDELPLFIVMSLGVILSVFDIDWFYQGIEEYSYITIRNAIIKFVSLFAIFMFVRSEGDYIIYGFISVLGTGLSGVLNVIHSRRYVKFSLKNINLWTHIKSLSTFFSLTFVITLYTNVDKTLLGFLDTSESVAFMSRGKTIITLATTFSASIATVTMPRASYYMGRDQKKFRELLTQVSKYLLLFTIPATAGIMILAPEIMFILGGSEFVPAANLLRIISFVTVLSALSTYLQTQVLTPSGNEKLGLFSSILSGIVSLISNLLLIPQFSYMGAGMALVLAEATAVVTRFIFVKKLGYTFITFFNKSTLKFFTASLIMVIPIFLSANFIDSFLLSFLVSILAGAGTYFLMLVILREESVNYFFDKSKIRLKRIKEAK